MVPRPQGRERSDAIGAALHCESKPVRDCLCNRGGAAGRDPKQQGFLINSRILVVRHRSVDSNHHAESMAQALLSHFCADCSFGPHHPIP
eukprot:8544392-Lingulodinium_polyedra.AAC.1